MLKTIAKNIFSNYVGIAGAIIIAFVLSPFLVHTLGDTNYGIWSVISALTGYMALLDLGVSSAMAKYVAQHKALKDYSSVNKVIGSGLAIMIPVGAMLLLVSPLLAAGVVRFFNFEDAMADTVHTLILIASLDIGIFVITGVLVGSMFGFQRFEIINGITLTVSLLKAIAFYYTLSAGYGLLAMGVISLIGNTLSAIFLYLAMRSTEPDVRMNPLKADKPTVVSIFHFSRFTFLSMVAMQLVYYSDAFVIGYFMSAAAITYYTIPWSLSEYTNKLTLAIAQTFVPVFSAQDATQGDTEIYNTYVTGTKFMLLISNLLCIGILAVGYYFVSIWMGPTYAEKCSVLLIIMFFTQLIKGPQLLSYSILLATSRHKVFSFYNFGFSLLNLCLSIFLVQHYGLVGVAASTAITQIIFYGIITPILTSKVLDSSLKDYYRDTYLRSIPSVIVLFVTLKYMSSNTIPQGYIMLLGQALIAAIFYIGVAYATLLNRDERQFLLAGLKNVMARIRPTQG